MDWKFFIRSSRWCPRYLIGSRGKSALWPKSKEVLRMEYWILKCNNVAAKRIASIHMTNKLSVISQALGEKIRKIKKLIKGCESNLSLEISKIFLVSFVDCIKKTKQSPHGKLFLSTWRKLFGYFKHRWKMMNCVTMIHRSHYRLWHWGDGVHYYKSMQWSVDNGNEWCQKEVN